MRQPLEKYCNLCGAPIVPEIRNYGPDKQPIWYYSKRCQKCFKKRTHYKRHFLPGLHGNSRPEGSKHKHDNYIMIKHNGQWRREHRVIMEQLLGRPLLRSEIVHHNNENPPDNRPENLQLCSSKADHSKYHIKNRLCSIKGCTKPHKGHGFCTLHYQRFKHHGDPLYERIQRICSVKGCNKKHVGLGFCKAHYKKFKKYGDPLYKKV
jgi:hypothetical protein